MKHFVAYLLVGVYCFILTVKVVHAKTLFFDDFRSLNENCWDISLNSGSIDYTTDGILLSSDLSSFPFIGNKQSCEIIPATGDFVIKIRFRYPEVESMGDGIGVGYFKESGDTLIQFGVWQDSTTGFYYQNNDFYLQGTCQNINSFLDWFHRRNIVLSHLDKYSWHIYELERVGGAMKFYVDRDKYPNPLYIDRDFSCGSKDVFIGNKYTGGSMTWTSLEVDMIKVTNNEIDELENKKVIIVPGLGASWNARGVLGSNDQDLKWELPFFVKHYENLKNAFISNGYTEGQNLFLWTYDWRKPVAEIVRDFDDYLATVTDNDDDIVIIGHSLGGLTARLWYQKNLGDTRVDKVISLGSPHMGSVDAYEAWNGGNVSRTGLHSIAFNILVLLNKGRTESIPEVIHRIAPVTQDLQPTFNFVFKDNSLVPFTDLTDFNSYLVLENMFGETGLPALNTFAGVGIDTKEFLSLGERTFFDKRLDLWPNGHLIDRTFSNNGDNTALLASASWGDNLYEISSDHGNLPDESINQIMDLLGLSKDNLNLVDYDFSLPQIIFYIASPAHLEVNCGGDDRKSDDMGFVVINKSEVGASCQVNVVADGDGGDYKLVVGDSQNSWWSSFNDNVGTSQTDTYRFDTNAMLLKDDDVFEIYRNYCLGLMDDYVGEKYLNDCTLACDNREAEALLDSVFGFRDKYRDFNISWEMLDKLIPLLKKDGISREVAEYMLKNGGDMFDLVDAVAELKEGLSVITDDFGVESYAMAQKVFDVAGEDFDSGQYGLVDARFDLARRILRQIW